MSDSIIKINAGGKKFETQISTLTKYPESILAVMFNPDTDEDVKKVNVAEWYMAHPMDGRSDPWGMTPMAKTEDGSYFLDVNPLHFGEILDYLRYGKISTDDPTLIKGIGKLANHFGLTDLAFELECDRDWVILDLERQKKIEISKKSLTRFKSTKLAGFFLGEEEAKIELSHWIKKEAGNRYYIATGRDWCWIEHMLNFLRQPLRYHIEKQATRTHIMHEMNHFGFSKGTHFDELTSGFLKWKEVTEE